MAYDIRHLLNYNESPFPIKQTSQEQVICDIDKTYLETRTSSIFDLAKAALETSQDKKTVLDANKYLEALLWSEKKSTEYPLNYPIFPKNLHFVSASPPQLKTTLVEKFLMDRLCWSSITLKNQLYNIKKIKFHLLREQFSFKTLAIFHLFDKNPRCEFFLIGDNAESDPYIYTGIKLFKDGTLSHKGYMEFLRMAGLTRESIRTVAQSKGFLKPAKIKNIFIRDLGTNHTTLIDPYITKFKSYKNLFLQSYQLGYLSEKIFAKILRELYGKFHSLEHSQTESLYKDLLLSDYSQDEAKDFIFKMIQGEPTKNFAKESFSNTNDPNEDHFLCDAKSWFQKAEERSIEL